MNNSETESQFSKKPPRKYFVAKSLSLVHKAKATPEEQLPEQKTINIFKEAPSESDYKQKLGPSTDKNGEIMKHTLVGKVDWYLKQKNGKKTNFDENFLKQAGFKTQGTAGVGLKFEDDKSYKNNDNRSVNKQKVGQDIKKQNRRMQLTTKGQILDEMQQKKFILLENQEKEKQYIDLLPELQKKYVTKEQRIFDKHKDYQDNWNLFIEKAASKLERDPSYSQLIRAEQFRKKLETAQTFEVLKTDLEKFGPRIWYMTLRKSVADQGPTDTITLNKRELQVEKVEKYPLIINEDLPNAFMHSQVNGMKQSIEYIRRPIQLDTGRCQTLHSMSMSNYSKSVHNVSCIPFTSFKSDQFLMEKMNNYSKKIKESLMIPYDKIQEIDGLMVNGKSQFQTELDSVTRDRGDNTAIYYKFVDKENNLQASDSNPEEIIEMRYSKQEQLKFPPVTTKKKMMKTFHKSDEKQSNDNSLNMTTTDFFEHHKP